VAEFSPKEHLIGITERTREFLVKDLTALPEDKAATSPGGDGRAPIFLVAECGVLNGFIATFLTTGEAPPSRTEEERKAHLASFDTREKALEYLNTETDRLLAAIRDYDDTRWGEKSDIFGRPMSLYSLAEMPGVHMMYHER
jgi:hypothetical protein